MAVIILDDIKFVARSLLSSCLEPGGVMILEDIPDESLLEELTALFTPEEQEGIRVFDVRESGRFDDLFGLLLNSSTRLNGLRKSKGETKGSIGPFFCYYFEKEYCYVKRTQEQIRTNNFKYRYGITVR